MKSGTRAAKLAFFYGIGDGKRVVDAKRLAEIGEITVQTVNNNIRDWEAEYAELISNSSECGISLNLSAEVLKVHKANTDALETACHEIRAELVDIPEVEKLLKRLISAMAEAGANGLEIGEAMELLRAWRDLSGTKKAVRAQLIQMQKAWKENAGIDSLVSVTETREKTLATGRAKQQLEVEKLANNQDPAQAPSAKPGSRDSAFAGPPAPPVEDGLEDLDMG